MSSLVTDIYDSEIYIEKSRTNGVSEHNVSEELMLIFQYIILLSSVANGNISKIK